MMQSTAVDEPKPSTRKSHVWPTTRRDVSPDPGLEDVVRFGINPELSLVEGLNPVVSNALCQGPIRSIVGPPSKQVQYTHRRRGSEGLDDSLVSLGLRRHVTFVPSLSDTNAMSGILRRRLPSVGDTAIGPSPCEILSSHRSRIFEPADDLQPKDNGSSMAQRCYWILRIHPPMHFHPSSRVWVVSMR